MELAVVVAELNPCHAFDARINFEAEWVPAALVRVLQIRAYRDDGSGTHEERERLELSLVRDPARAVESRVGPEVVPPARRQVDIAPAAWLEHRGDQQIGAKQIFVVDMPRRRVGRVGG